MAFEIKDDIRCELEEHMDEFKKLSNTVMDGGVFSEFAVQLVDSESRIIAALINKLDFDK